MMLLTNLPSCVILVIYLLTPFAGFNLGNSIFIRTWLGYNLQHASFAADTAGAKALDFISSNPSLIYDILAFACKRAGKSRDEGRSYYSTGVLFDNLGKFKDAIGQYEKFL